MAVSNLALVWLDGDRRHERLAVRARARLELLATSPRRPSSSSSPAPSERGRLIGFSDLALELHGRGARARSAASSTPAGDGARASPRCSRSFRPWCELAAAAAPPRPCRPSTDSLLQSARRRTPGSPLSLHEDLQRKAGRDRARLVRRRRRGADPRPPRDPDRRHAARQEQAAVHAARRHRRLRRRRERREDRRHRQEARPEDVLPALRLPGRPQAAAAARAARRGGRRRSSARRSRACSRATGSAAQQLGKLKIYAGPEHPHAGAGAEAVGGEVRSADVDSPPSTSAPASARRRSRA